MDRLILPDAAWRHRPGLDALVAALGPGAARFVGGAVRDTLLGLPVSDVDIATPLPPDEVMARLRAAGLKTVPTGIAHGTVTAVLDRHPVEVTTLRRDVATDGRRAVVAFSDDWREDAARRDFTINALYADPADGRIHDWFGGIADLTARRVRFIGDPLARIAEDHLRILRFFRFHARFGDDAPDEAGFSACVARANDLMALSRERIADELSKLLIAARGPSVVARMHAAGILIPILPEVGRTGVDRLLRLAEREAAVAVAPAWERRLAALLPADPAVADAVAARLRLSNARRKRIVAAATGSLPGDPPRRAAWQLGVETLVDRALIAAPDMAAVTRIVAAVRDFVPPRLPISGGDLIRRGVPPGPAVAQLLKAVEQSWAEEDFPDPARVAAIADAAADQWLRAASS